MANEILNKTAYRYKSLHPSTQVLSFNWGPWDGGMVTPEIKRLFKERGVYIIPLSAGVQLFVNELSAVDNRCPQILIGNNLAKPVDDKLISAREEGALSVKKPQVSRLSRRVYKTLQTTNNAFLADHKIGGDTVFPTVCAIAWMSDAAEAVYSRYVFQGFEQYQLFKGIVLNSTALNGTVLDSTNLTEYLIDLNATVEGDELRVDAKVSSLNAQGKPVFHYGAQLILVTEAAKQIVLETERTLMQVLPTVTLPVNLVETAQTAQTIQTSEEALALYHNGTLFHGASLQGIKSIIHCDEQGLLLACQVAENAEALQGEFPLPQQNIFANDLVYQAMLVWVKKQIGLSSLPSSTQSWTVYRQVKPNECFYLQLKVVNRHTNQNNNNNKLVSNIQLFSEDRQLLADIKAVEVTASENLHSLFIPDDLQNELKNELPAVSSLPSVNSSANVFEAEKKQIGANV